MTRHDAEFVSGERVYLGRSPAPETEALHLDRYRFALTLTHENDTVLDAASGSGYGAQILAQRVANVIGLEISDHALTYARSHHSLPNVEYHHADLNYSIPLPDAYFDKIVSFETLEHVKDQEGLLAEFRRLLKPGGLAILSTPDRDVRTFRNRFHVHELSRREFVRLVAIHFKVEGLYGQLTYVPSSWRTLLRWLAFLGFLEPHIRSAATLGLVRPLRNKLLSDAPKDRPAITATAVEVRRSHVFLIIVASVPQ